MQGASKVLVEQKGGSSEDFGKGRKIHMTFGQLVQQLHSGNDSLYLTTQEVNHLHASNTASLSNKTPEGPLLMPCICLHCIITPATPHPTYTECGTTSACCCC